LSGDASYEFYFKAIKAGASTAIAGNDAFAIKLDQWNERGVFGTTAFGVADNVFTPVEGKSVASVFDRNVHVVVVNDTAAEEIRLYVDGDHVGVLSGNFELSGEGKVMGARINANTDPMGEGSVMHEWSTYDNALTDEQIAGLAAAFAPKVTDLDSAEFELVAGPSDIYDGESLINGWVNAGGDVNFELSGSHLSLVSAANNGWLQHDNDESVWEKGVADGGSWTAEISIRLANDEGNGIVIWGANGAERNILQVNTHNTQTLTGTVLDENDNTDAFHTFRLAFEAEKGLYYVWRDGVLLTPDGIAKQAGTGANRFIVGDCCSGIPMTTVDLAYIRYDTTGAYSPGEPAPEAPAPAELPWSVGLNDDGWPAGDGGGPNTTFVQEAGSNELPGNPANGEGAREGDDDYYWAGDYSMVIAGNGDYTPVGKVMANEESAERAFAGTDNDLRYHFNLPDTLKSTDQLSVSYDALNLHGGQADSRYGIEVYVNNVQVQSEVVIRPEQLGQTYETDPFTLASVNAEVGSGYDNIITLKGVNYNAEGGGNWMGIDYVQLSQVDDTPEQTLLFGDNLDSDSSGNWAIHKSTDDTAVTFGYDYSADGIPAAPNSDGSTVGVKFEANIAAPTGAEAVSISPVGVDLKGDYEVQFDMWINANGPFPGGGGGSTEFLTAGVGTTGDHLQWAADTADGAWFGVTGEGGSGNSGDFRAHIGGTRQAAESGAYAAGSTADSRNNTNAHYADAFPGQSPPAAQATAFPGKQTGALQHGAVGFAWRQVTITKVGDSVTWAIDGVTIATLDQSLGAFTTEGNIFVGYYDAFSSVSDNPATSFGLVDNIQVVEIETTLPPALSIVNNGDGTVTVTFEGRLEAAATVNGPWQDSGLTSPATIPADQAMQYGRAVK